MNIQDVKTVMAQNPEEGINGYILNFAGGGLSQAELRGLQSLVDKVYNKFSSRPMVCADVGVAKGTSSAALAFKMQEYHGHVVSVDDYRGWKVHEDQWAQAKCSDIFKLNMQQLGLDKDITLVEKSSEEASQMFNDGYFDLVFLDASHHYKEVVKDIENWKPKVRKSGILCGHDCQVITKDGKVDLRAWQNISGETTGYDQQDFHWHIGVMLAVGDKLPEAQIIPETTIWWVQL